MKHNRGFSLVELSVVLVILGLLVGGVLSGQQLIRASELRSITTDVDRYIAAAQTFRNKYDYYPGDFPGAVGFWGAAAGATTDGYDATCAALTTASTSQTTCNGDGNGTIRSQATTGTYYEVWRAVQHLSNAGLISGTYSGVMGVAAQPFVAITGTNTPQSKIQKAGYTLYWLDPGTSDLNYYPLSYGHIIAYGAELLATQVPTYGPFLRPQEAWNIDSKIDDGLPLSGKVVSFKSTSTRNPGCTTTATTDSPTATTYVLSSSSNLCHLTFITGF